MSDAEMWFATSTAGAPLALLARVKESLAASPPAGSFASRLATAGEQSLGDAIRRGTGREAALDLLAADALITLALLETAARHPSGLGATARRCRDAAVLAG